MEAEGRKRGIETLTAAFADYTKTLDKRSTQERQLPALGMLAKTMRNQGAFYGDNSTYGLALQKIGEVQGRLDKVQAGFVSFIIFSNSNFQFGSRHCLCGMVCYSN